MTTILFVIHILHRLGGLLPLIGLALVGVILVGLLAMLVRKLLGVWYLLKQQVVYLELTPPAFTDRTPGATQQLFSVLHTLGSRRGLLDQVLNRATVFSLEIVSSRELGIRYIVRVSSSQADGFEQTIHAYLPEVQLRRIENYLAGRPVSQSVRIVGFSQKQHFAYPLMGHEALDEHDPIAYLGSAMTKLEPGELIVFQLIIIPTVVREAEVMRRKILSNEDLSGHLEKTRVPHGTFIFSNFNKLLFGLIEGIGEIAHGTSNYTSRTHEQDLFQRRQVAMKVKPARSLSLFETERIDSIHEKLSQPMFKTSIRTLVVSSSKQAANTRIKGFESAMASYAVAGYQSLDPKHTKLPLLKRYQWFSYMNRLPGQSSLLSSTEVSSLYHFPHSVAAQTENVVKSLSKTLPAPVSLKNGTKLDVLLGENHYHGTSTPIGLTSEDRQRHIYIVGGTGSGKTTTLLYAINQDISSGKGVAVVDPHGDLAETILRHVPKERLDDVIYFNPRDLDYPIGLNLLELPEGLSGSELLHERDRVTESIISVLRKVFSEDDSGGHRIEYVLRNTIHTALTVEGATLFTVLKLLTDSAYRKQVTRKLKDEDLRSFWKEEMGKAGDMQRIKMSSGVTAKIGRFRRSVSAERILGQVKSTIDFDDILNSSKILICNFSKGRLGEDTSALFGTTVLAKLQLAATRRESLEPEDRTPFYLYVDEFQNFATSPFVEMLSEARKYKLFLTMAEQSTSQQQQGMVETILANVGTVICFRTGSPADERLILPLFSPYIEPGAITNLPAYNFYIRIAAVHTQEPMSGVTLLLDDPGSEDMAQVVTTTSRKRYAHKYDLKDDAPELKQKPEAVSTGDGSLVVVEAS